MVRPVYVLVSVSAVFFSLYFAEMSGFFKPTPRRIGHIELSTSPLRRLLRSHFTWDRAWAGEGVFAGDTLSVGETTTAQILFDQGGALNLWPGSMVVLRESLDELKFDFVLGSGEFKETGSTRRKIKISFAENTGNAAHPFAVLPVVQEQSISKSKNALDTEGKDITEELLPPTPTLLEPDQDSIVQQDQRSVTRLKWSMIGSGRYSFEVSLKNLTPLANRTAIESQRTSFH